MRTGTNLPRIGGDIPASISFYEDSKPACDLAEAFLNAGLLRSDDWQGKLHESLHHGIERWMKTQRQTRKMEFYFGYTEDMNGVGLDETTWMGHHTSQAEYARWLGMVQGERYGLKRNADRPALIAPTPCAMILFAGDTAVYMLGSGVTYLESLVPGLGYNLLALPSKILDRIFERPLTLINADIIAKEYWLENTVDEVHQEIQARFEDDDPPMGEDGATLTKEDTDAINKLAWDIVEDRWHEALPPEATEERDYDPDMVDNLLAKPPKGKKALPPKVVQILRLAQTLDGLYNDLDEANLIYTEATMMDDDQIGRMADDLNEWSHNAGNSHEVAWACCFHKHDKQRARKTRLRVEALLHLLWLTDELLCLIELIGETHPVTLADQFSQDDQFKAWETYEERAYERLEAL